jgi:DNA replication protein DnaC
MTTESLAAMAKRVFSGVGAFVSCARCGQQTTRTGARTLCYACSLAEDAFADQRLLLEQSIPETYQWATLKAPELAERVMGGAQTVARARDVTLHPRVLLIGAAGAGKTSLAVAMVRQWSSARRMGALFVSVPAFAGARLRAPLGREAEDVTAAVHAPLVLMDDLGGEREITTSPVTDVLRWRHERGQPTWVTTWLDPDGLSARYGAGIARRVVERAVVLRVPGGA